MTAYVVLNSEPLGRVFTAPGYSPSFSDESLIHLRAGERMTVADLLRGMLLASGNDAAMDVAVNTSGSVGAFVAQMNRSARGLGLRHTHYTNPIGLDSAGNYSSASDLVRLAAVLRGRAWFARTVDRGGAVLHSNLGAHAISNLNDLVRHVGFVNGVKTGHTPSAGYCLVGSATRNGVTMISAVLGDPSAYARNADTLALLRFGLSRYRSYTAFGTADVLATAKVRYRESDTIGLVPARAFSTVVRRGERVPQLVVHAPKKLDGPAAGGSQDRLRRRRLPRPRDRPGAAADPLEGPRGRADPAGRDVHLQTGYPRGRTTARARDPPDRPAPGRRREGRIA